ncbi:MAG: APC family permease [Pseudomonadota bacterium]|nr:APC family permease [Pseudomonadota bacterium]
MAANERRGIGHLLRILGLAFGLAVVVGGVVGQGILRTPGIVAGAVPEPSWILLLWVAGGLVILIDACSLVELGASIPKAGGPYALARRAFGYVGGTVVGWGDWLTNVLVLSFISVVFGEYCHRLGIGTGWPVGAIALLLIIGCSAINWTGTRISGASQTLLSAFKGAALIALVVALFVMGGEAAPAAATAPAQTISPTLAVGGLLVAMSAILNTYGGWTGSVYFGEEIVTPERNIARATFGGVLFVLALYVAVNAAMLHVLTPAEMAASELPAADAAARVFGASGGTLITVVSLISLGAIANLYIMFSSRIGFAMARDGVLPRLLARTSASGTPRPAMIAGSAVAAAAALSGTYLELVAVVVPLTAAIIASLDLAAIVMRIKEPDLPRPFKMPLFPLPSIVGLLLNLTLLTAMVIDDPWHSALGIGAALVFGVGYALLGRRTAGD